MPDIGYVAGGPITVPTWSAPLDTPLPSRRFSAEVVEESLVASEVATESDALSEQEVAILQMFVEFKDHHNADDVVKRTSLSPHKADYFLDRLRNLHLIAHLNEYRNGKPVFFITHEGRKFLVEHGFL